MTPFQTLLHLLRESGIPPLKAQDLALAINDLIEARVQRIVADLEIPQRRDTPPAAP